MAEKILTINPDPAKNGVRIDKDRYDFMRKEILDLLKDKGPLGAMQMVREMDARLTSDQKIGFSIDWYLTAVRLDLEARGEINYDRLAKKPVITLLPKK